MKYILLLLLAILLAVVLLPIGFVVGMFYSGRGEHLYKICQGIDQLGNVVCARLFDAILIKKSGYQFGNEDEVISSVLGKNCQAGTLTFVGKALNALLNAIWKNHTIKAIENFTITILFVLFSSFTVNAQMQFHWRQVSGPVPTVIDNPDSANTIVKQLNLPGNYEYELTVTNAFGEDKDSVTITVLPGTVLAIRPDSLYYITRPEIKKLEIKVMARASDIFIQIKSPRMQEIECGLFDIYGRKLAKIDLKVMKGTNYMTVPKPRTKGLYILKFATYFESRTEKIML